MSRTAVVLMNLGGPGNQDEVEPFLANLFGDVIRFPWGTFGAVALGRLIARRRKVYAQGMYRQIGGGSPILAETEAQVGALQSELGDNYHVTCAMRYSMPLIEGVKRDLAMANDPWDQVIGLPLFPQYSYATTRTCQQAWQAGDAQDEGTSIIGPFHRHPDYIGSITELIRATLEGQDDPADIHLVFSAHSVPVSYIRRGDVYQAQIQETVDLVMAGMSGGSGQTGLPNPHSLAYQSRVGPVKWLGPATIQHMRDLAHQGIKRVAVVPIAFVCEHLETLYELDILVRDFALEAGITSYLRVPAPGVHPRFIGALADIVHHADRYALA